jgi:hypothetical protein
MNNESTPVAMLVVEMIQDHNGDFVQIAKDSAGHVCGILPSPGVDRKSNPPRILNESIVSGSEIRKNNAPSKFVLVLLDEERRVVGVAFLFLDMQNDLVVVTVKHNLELGAFWIKGLNNSILVEACTIQESKYFDLVYLRCRSFSTFGNTAIKKVVKPSHTGGFSINAVNNSGDSVSVYGATAGVLGDENPFVMKHTASTLPGFSGAPMVRNSCLVGIHKGSLKGDGGQFNVCIVAYYAFIIDGIIPVPARYRTEPTGPLILDESSETDSAYTEVSGKSFKLYKRGQRFDIHNDNGDYYVTLDGNAVGFSDAIQFEREFKEAWADVIFEGGYDYEEIMNNSEALKVFRSGRIPSDGQLTHWTISNEGMNYDLGIDVGPARELSPSVEDFRAGNDSGTTVAWTPSSAVSVSSPISIPLTRKSRRTRRKKTSKSNSEGVNMSVVENQTVSPQGKPSVSFQKSKDSETLLSLQTKQ